MVKAFNDVYASATKDKTSFRSAAYGIGIDRIVTAEKMRGHIHENGK